MAYVSKEKKAKIAAQLKRVVPKDWKYSLAVRHHSTIVMTIRSAPINLLQVEGDYQPSERTYRDVNTYHLDGAFHRAAMPVIRDIIRALNTDNFDESDSMTDYFHVGHYVDLNIGNWEKPFLCTTPTYYAPAISCSPSVSA